MRTSVIIPVHNGADRLAAAVASARPQLGANDEIIIIDDGSTDGTSEVIAALGGGIVAVRQDKAGSAAARNHGLRLSTADCIAFLDHDDLWPPGRQRLLAAALAAAPLLDIAMGRVDIVLDERDCAPMPGNPRHVTTHRPWHLDALLMRRGVFDRVGPFDETLANASDTDWYMRAREAGLRYGAIDAVTVQYRLHGTNLSRRVADARHHLLGTLQGALARRRSA